MKEVRVGVVGAGGIFTGGHLPAYVKVPEARLVAIADPSEYSLKRALRRIEEVFSAEIKSLKEKGLEDQAERLREILSSIKIYRDYREMLRKEDIDLVDVCTPHKFHKPIAVDALRAGAHVMVEKPMARTYIEALEIVEAVRETGKLYQHNENYIFSRGNYTVRRLIEAGTIGEVSYLTVPGSHEGPEWKEWFWDPNVGGGGSMLDMGVHSIGVAWYLVGLDKRPTVVKAEKFTGITIKIKNRFIAGVFTEIKVEDDAHVLINFEDPKDSSWTTALIEGSWSGKEIEHTAVFGTKGMITVRGVNGKAVVDITDYLGVKRTIEVQEYVFDGTIIREISNMCKCVLSGRKSILDEEKGAEIMAIIDAAYYSEMNGRRAVSLDEFKRFAEKLIEKYGSKASDEFIKMKVSYLSRL